MQVSIDCNNGAVLRFQTTIEQLFKMGKVGIPGEGVGNNASSYVPSA